METNLTKRMRIMIRKSQNMPLIPKKESKKIKRAYNLREPTRGKSNTVGWWQSRERELVEMMER